MKKCWFLGETGALFAADQILKSYAEQNIDRGEEKTLTEHIVLRRVPNKGLCFNLLSDRPGIVRILSFTAAVIVSLFHILILFRTKGFWKKNAFSLMAAGAWSNTFDRFARGHVIDYIGFKCGNKKLSSVTYNLADILITAGALLLSVISMADSGQKKEEN